MADARTTARSLAKPFVIGSAMGCMVTSPTNLCHPASCPPKPPKFTPLSTRAEQLERLKAGDLDAASMGRR
ncbi:mitochondrial glycerol-3-phosphate dehydrogenase [Rhizina undulata]